MSRKKVVALIANVPGAELFDESPPGEVHATVWTPAGVTWVATGDHCLGAYSRTPPTAPAWADMAERIQLGTRPCDQLDCDTCTGA